MDAWMRGCVGGWLRVLQASSVTDQIVNLQDYIQKLHNALFPYLSDKYPEHFPAEKFTKDLLTWSALNVWGQSNIKLYKHKMARHLDSRCVLVPVPWVLGPKHVSNPALKKFKPHLLYYYFFPGRSFDCSARDPADKKRRTWGLIPLADLVNHESYIESFYGDNKGKGPFTCWASECLTEGAQIYQSYGSHRSSTHFFLYYGFVPNYLQSDYIAMRLPGAEWKAIEGQAKQYNQKLTRSRLIGFAGIDGHISEYFLTAYRDVLRIHKLIPEDDWKASRGMKYTLEHIARKLSKYIAAFTTTRETDFHELTQPFESYVY